MEPKLQKNPKFGKNNKFPKKPQILIDHQISRKTEITN
jgi:hypothetical protein